MTLPHAIDTVDNVEVSKQTHLQCNMLPLWKSKQACTSTVQAVQVPCIIQSRLGEHLRGTLVRTCGGLYLKGFKVGCSCAE